MMIRWIISNDKIYRDKGRIKMKLLRRIDITGKKAIAVSAVFLALGGSSLPSFAAESIVFIGNSFTYGARAPNVQAYRPSTVTDLNGGNVGGVPALFKAFTTQAGRDYNVSLETVGGTGFQYHFENKQPILNSQPWDHVVMHGHSLLNLASPGNTSEVIDYSNRLAQMFTATNPNVDVNLMATWSRADQTYRVTTGPWFGKDITQMGEDIAVAYAEADRQSDFIDGVIPVGLAWNRAMETGFADINPYDGIDAGKINLWGSDSYHGSMYGYYLEALTIFGDITRIDPRSLGSNEYVARELGISQVQAAAMQQLAFEQLVASGVDVPEPATIALFGLGALGLLASRRRARKAM